MGGGGRRNSGGGSSSSSSSSSSGEEDGDADWRAAIDSVATSTTFGRTTTDALASTCNGSTTKSIGRATQRDEVTDHKQQNVKHYQIKAQKLLDEILEKTTEIVRDPIPILNGDHKTDEGGVRLFKNAPPGIVFDHIGYLASLVIT